MEEDTSSGSDIEEFSGIEQPPLLQQLKRILDEYRNDVQIIKELVQNADDAGAREMKVLYQGKTINEPILKEKKYRKFLRAPALTFYNNAEFNENDWRGIKTIYSSVKADDPLKVGRFGLGFKSVFHLTDYPCIISGDRLLFIDPHERKTGKVCVTIKLRNISKCKGLDIDDCLRALNNTFGFCKNTLECGQYHGTIFWFPLRTAATKLSEDLYGNKEVKHLLNSFITESKRSLTFLNSLCRVTMFIDLPESFQFAEIDSETKRYLQQINFGKSKHFFSVEIEDCNGTFINVRRDFLAELKGISGNIQQKSKYWIFDVHVKTELTNVPNKVEFSKSRWLIINYLKGSETSKRMRELLEDENLCQNHLVGIAAPVYDSDDPLNEYSSSAGHVFCYLPLPQESKSVTGLPVHINAFFALSQNRRHVKWPDLGEDVVDKAIEWNLLLVSEIFPDAYCQLLMQMIDNCKKNGNPKHLVHSVYNLIPRFELVGERWRKLALRFVKLALKENVFITKNVSRQWVTAEKVLIEPPNSDICWTAVEKLLLMDDITVAKIPHHVMIAFEKKLSMVTPVVVSEHMRRSDTYKKMSMDEKANLLKYICSEDKLEFVENLELLPLENNTCVPFRDGKDVFLEDSTVTQLFPGHESQFVLNKADFKTKTILKEMIEKGYFQLKYMHSDDFAKLIKQTLDENFHRETMVAIGLQCCQKWKDWIQKVWAKIQEKHGREIETFCKLAIFPLIPAVTENSWEDATTMNLLRLTDLLLQIKNYNCRNVDKRENLFQSLKLLSVSVVRDIPKWINTQHVQKYIYNDTFDRLTAMLERLCDRDINKFNEQATTEQRQQLLLFLSNKINDEPSDKCVQLLTKLNVFKEVDNLEMSRQRFICLAENRNVFMGAYFPVHFPIPHVVTEVEINKQFLRYTKVNIVTEEDMVRQVLNEIQNYQMEEKEKFMLWLLLQEKYLRNKEIKTMSQQVAFIIEDNCEARRACELFDPDDKQLQKIFQHEPLFPRKCEKYNPDIVQGFRKLGMRTLTDITYKDVENTCLIIDSMSSDSVQHDVSDKAEALITFLNEHKELLCKDALWDLCIIPLPKERFINYCPYFPCKTLEYESQLCRPSEIKSSKYAHLIGSVTCLIETKRLWNLSQVFEWEKEPQVQEVVEHLNIVVRNYQQRYKSSCLEMVTNIYKWLANQELQTVQIALHQTFANEKFIWAGDGFAHPKYVIVERNEHDINMEPFICILPEELRDMKQFFCEIGCGKYISVDTYVDVLARIKDFASQNSKCMSNSSLKNIAILILNKLKSDFANEVRDSGKQVYFPVQTGDNTSLVMKPANLCTFRDGQWLNYAEILTDDDEVFYIHADVPFATAEILGVPSLSQQMLSDAEAFEEWGQEEPLTRRLYCLLQEGYVDGFSVAKELFQNADDAGASKFWIMYDERENKNARTQLISEGMAEWQGPALWVYNDAEFTDSDFKNITKLNGGTKEDDSTKIGKFGLGFCAVYNVTDVPSFVSRDNVVIFDPHTSFLAQPGKTPGIKINVQSMKNLKMMKYMQNQFKPFENVFGCKLLSGFSPYFKGTLFRLPLRRKPSEISNNVYSKEEVKALFEKIMGMSANLFIFNQNVEELKLFHLPSTFENPNEACQIFEIKKETIRLKTLPQCLFAHEGFDLDATETDTKPTSVMVAVTRWKKKQRLKEEPVSILDKVSIRVTTLLQNNNRCSVAAWFVSWSTAMDDKTLAITYEEKGALPLCAVAVPVSEGNKTSQIANHSVIRIDQISDGFYPTGHFFFFLPLPIEHNFQWHINGQFAVTSDRRNLRSATEDDINMQTKVWNECLLNNTVVLSVLHLLENLKIYCDLDTYPCYFLWPRSDNAQITRSLPVSFYKHLTNTETFSIFRSSTRWLTFSESIFLHTMLRHNVQIGDTAFEFMSELIAEQNLVDIPQDVYDLLLEVAPSATQLKTIELESFFLEYFLPNLSRFQSDSIRKHKRDILLKFALMYDSVKISEWMKGNACIPTHSKLMKISDLVDPNSRVGSMFTVSDEYFPAAPFNEAMILVRLRELGIMHETISDSLVIERAISIYTLNRRCSKCALERYNLWLEYLVENREIHKKALPQVKSIPCLPIMERPQTWPFHWEADGQFNAKSSKLKTCKDHKGIKQRQCVFERPFKLHDGTHANLVGSLFLMFDQNDGVKKCSSPRKELLCNIGVNGTSRRHIEPKCVLEQLVTICQTYKASEAIKASAVTSIFEDVYQYIEGAIDQQCIAIPVVKEVLSQQPIIYVNGILTTSECVAEELLENCLPYLYGLQGTPLSKCKSMIKVLGIRKHFMPKDILNVLQKIYLEKGNTILSEDSLQACLKLLTCLYESMQYSGLKDVLNSELGAIYAPDSQCILRDTRTMCFDDYDSIEKSETMIYIHGSVSVNAAKLFGVKKKIIQNLEENAEDIEDFYQEEPLLARLKRLVEGYPCDAGIFRELIQNADDSGATEICFVKDYTSHVPKYATKDDEVFSSFLLGPSLCVFNNMSFSQKDLVGIQKLGRGSKGDDPIQTGRYGVGFNAVYNITDVPSFLTRGPDIENGETLCFFDPNAKYVPMVTKQRPGKRYKNLNTIRKLHKYLIYGYHEKIFFKSGKGTMFRFPLRNEEMAKLSEIKIQEVTEEVLTSLLQSFSEELTETLIFLRNLRNVTLLTYNGRAYSREYRLEVETSELDEEKRKQFIEYQKNANIKEDKAFTLSQKFVHYNLACKELKEKETVLSKYLVVQCFGFHQTSEIPAILKQEYSNGKIGLLPHGGVALRLSEKTEKRQKKCRAFCFLPLPIETGLPVYVHGYFALDHESRRSVWLSDNPENCYRTVWNLMLMKNVICPAYIHLTKVMQSLLLEQFVGVATPYQVVHNAVTVFQDIFPDYNAASHFYWKELAKEFYKALVLENIPFLPIMQNTVQQVPGEVNKCLIKETVLTWTTLNISGQSFPAYFREESEHILNENHMLSMNNVFRDIGMRIVYVSNIMLSSMESSGVPIQTIKPKHVIDFLCSYGKLLLGGCMIKTSTHVAETTLKSKSNACAILKYCLEDKENFWSKIEDIPIFITEDDIVRALREVKPLFVSEFCDFFEDEKHLFVNKAYISFFKDVSLKSFMHKDLLKPFTLEDFLVLANRSTFITANKNELTGWDTIIPSVLWIKKFWEFFHSILRCYDGGILEAFKVISNISILPAVRKASDERLLVPISMVSHLIDLKSFSTGTTIMKCLEKLQIPEIDKESFPNDDIYKIVLEQVPKYTQPQQIAKCLHFYKDFVKQSKMTDKEAEGLMLYFNNHVSQLNSVKDIVKGLPIFLSLTGEIVSLSDYLNICTVSEAIPKDGLNELSQTGLMLLSNHSSKDLFNFLDITAVSISDLYVKYIFPNEHKMRRAAFYRHLEYISIHLNSLSSMEEEQVLTALENIPFVEVGKKMVLVRDLFDPYHSVFKVMCQPSEILPKLLKREKLISLFKKIGLKDKMTIQLFERFAKQIAEDKTEDVRSQSELLCKELFSMGMQFLKVNSLENISSIKFIFPFKVDETLNKIQEQHFEQALICFSGSVLPAKQNICWTVSNILPVSADPSKNAFQGQDLQTVKDKLNITDPCFEVIKKHCENIGESLDRMMKEIPQYVPYNTVEIVVNDIYKALKQFSNNASTAAQLSQLANVPLIYYTRECMRKARYVVNNCKAEEEIKPYLQKSPVSYGEFYETFISLGATKEPSYNNYAQVLEAIYADFGDKSLLQPDVHRAAVKALSNMLKDIFRHEEEVCIELKVNKLYILNSAGYLCDAKAVVIANNPYLKDRLSKGITLNYSIALQSVCDKGMRIEDCISSLKRLSENHRPYLLTDIVGEKIVLNNIKYKDMREALSLEEFLHSKMFICGFVRLAKHAAKKYSILWSPEFQRKIVNRIRIIACKHVSGISTVLTLRPLVHGKLGPEEDVPKTRADQEYYLEEKNGNTVMYFGQNSPNWRKKVNEYLSVFFNQIVNRCLKESMLFHLLDILEMEDRPEAISAMLDKNSIDMYQCDIDVDSEELRYPKPGTFLPLSLFVFMSNDYSGIEEIDYKFIALEVDDPSIENILCEDVPSEEELSMDITNMLPKYIFVRILTKLESHCALPLFQSYEVDCGEHMPQTVPAYKLYTFIRNTAHFIKLAELDLYAGPSTSNAPSQSGATQTLKEIFADVRSYLQDARNDLERKYIYKRLMTRWHPDKNLDNVDLCTTVCQYIAQCLQKLAKGLQLNKDDDSDNNCVGQPTATSFNIVTLSPWYNRYRHNCNTITQTYRQTYREYTNFVHFFNTTHNCPKQRLKNVIKARVWQQQAQYDLEHAKACLSIQKPAFNWICYNCYQAAEKSLRAGWYANDLNNMPAFKESVCLNDIAKGLDRKLERLARKLSGLTKDPTRMRYPQGETNRPPTEIYDRATAQNAVDVTADMINIVQRQYLT